jgi:hypothetical protein
MNKKEIWETQMSILRSSGASDDLAEKEEDKNLSQFLGQKISVTKDLEKFSGSYDRTIAQIQLDEFGKIYYYKKFLEPVELEDLYNILDAGSGEKANL